MTTRPSKPSKPADPGVVPENELTPEVAVALAELAAARANVSQSLEGLTDASRSALDVPAKIRKNPVKAAALVGGAGFLLAGGPRRALRFAVGRVRAPKAAPYVGLMPPEIERVLKDAGLADDPEIRRALDEDFAEYLKSKGRYDPAPTASTSLWRTFDRLAGPLGTVGARILVQRIMEADRDRGRRIAETRQKARERLAKP